MKTQAPIVLVTANLGGIDPAFPLPLHPGVDAVYFADFDVPAATAATWDTVIRVERPGNGDARLRAKHPKCQIHKLEETAGYQYLAWADACFRFKSLAFLPELAARIGESENKAVFIPHPDRGTVAEEYAFVLDQVARGDRYLTSRYDAEPLTRERAHFATRYDLTQLPLWCGGLWMLPNSPTAHSFLDSWWDGVHAFSIMDQPSMTPLAAAAGLRVEPFAAHLYRNRMWDRLPHTPVAGDPAIRTRPAGRRRLLRRRPPQPPPPSPLSRKLLLCCGPDRQAGYVRLDANAKHAPDILATIPPLPAEVRAREWDVIELIHGIEHFLPWDARPLLEECWSVLRPGGVLVLEQPNIEAAARVLLGGPSPYKGVLESAMWPLYGDAAHHDVGYMHRYGYTPETLPMLLREIATWSSIRVLPQQYHTYAAGRDFRVEAVR